ncbi:MAG: hypothetical protein LWW93_01235 [Hyphomicrobiales bacterium]|nr:hypothetical protein [Hyphomicrobiales bacterium]
MILFGQANRKRSTDHTRISELDQPRVRSHEPSFFLSDTTLHSLIEPGRRAPSGIDVTNGSFGRRSLSADHFEACGLSGGDFDLAPRDENARRPSPPPAPSDQNEISIARPIVPPVVAPSRPVGPSTSVGIARRDTRLRRGISSREENETTQRNLDAKTEDFGPDPAQFPFEIPLSFSTSDTRHPMSQGGPPKLSSHRFERGEQLLVHPRKRAIPKRRERRRSLGDALESFLHRTGSAPLTP